MRKAGIDFFIYAIVLLSSIAAVYALIHLGATQYPVTIHPGLPASAPGTPGSLHQMLISLLVVIAAARVLGSAATALRQPRVVGEIIGGLLLGPSFLGLYFPETAALLLPASVFPFLSIIAQIGVLLFMFTIGLDLDLDALRRAGRTALAVSHASIIFPFLLGIILALSIFPSMAPLGVGFPGFALFIAIAMSITAFPVLARILSDFKMERTPIGVLALSCAAIDDASAWCLLALVVGILNATVGGAAVTTALTLAYILVMLFFIRPRLARLISRIDGSTDRISEGALALILMGLLLSASLTEAIGIHALFGAFFLGAIIPYESKVAVDLTARLQDLVRVFFLPAFFAFTGLRTEIGLLQSKSDLILCLLVIALATIGKFGGAFVAAKLSGLKTRESAVIGVLMNTRGLVELIVLNVGLDLHVLSPRLFTILVIMAVTTTLATGPGLLLLGHGAISGRKTTPAN